MIVVPLVVDGEAIGTLNIGRMGDDAAHFSANEFELTKLFAGQASIALQNAEAHGAVRVRADQDALTGLRNHGAFQRELGDRRVDAGAPPFAVAHARPRRVQDVQRRARPSGGRRPAGVVRVERWATRPATATGCTATAATSSRPSCQAPTGWSAHDVAERIRYAVHDRPADSAVHSHDQRGRRLLPGRRPDQGRAGGRGRPLAVPRRRRRSAGASAIPGVLADPYLRALDETPLPCSTDVTRTVLLETIVEPRDGLLGTPHGYVQLVEPDGSRARGPRTASGVFSRFVGCHLDLDEGLGGRVVRDRTAVRDRRLRHVGQPRARRCRRDPRRGRRRAAQRAATGRRRHRPRVGAQRAALPGARDRRAVALRPARVDRAWTTPASWTTPSAVPCTTRDRTAEPRAADRPHRPRPGLGQPGGADPIAVIMLDLDRFKVINESVGHVVGRPPADGGRPAPGRRPRPGDTVARFGGDEFGIILDHVADVDEARQIADRLGQELRTPFPLNGRDWFISASIGIAIGRPGRCDARRTPARGRDRDGPRQGRPVRPPCPVRAVDERADARAHRPRERPAPRTRARRAAPALPADGRPRDEGDRGLRGPRPLAAPDARAGPAAGVHPAGRGDRPDRAARPLGPRDRLPAGARGDRPAPGGSPLFISVNLSARQFAQPDLVEIVAGILESTRLAPGSLELEITESVVMDQSEIGIRTLRRLRDLGVRLVLDDFGTGLLVTRLPEAPAAGHDQDRPVVRRRAGQAADRSIVEAVVALAHGLDIGVVGEGIETEDQLRSAARARLRLGQGYLFARPLPASEAARMLGLTGRDAIATRAGVRRAPGPRRARSRAERPRAGPARTQGRDAARLSAWLRPPSSGG